MINLQPTLIGKLVKLRPIIAADFEPMAKAASDPLIWRCQKQYFRQKFFIEALTCGSCLTIQNDRSEIVGSSRYYNYRPSSKDIMIGYSFITRQCWGSSHNREVKHLMMTHIYQWVDTILFKVEASNSRSRKAVAKIGGQLLTSEEIQRRNLPSNNNKVIFQIKKVEFKGLV